MSNPHLIRSQSHNSVVQKAVNWLWMEGVVGRPDRASLTSASQSEPGLFKKMNFWHLREAIRRFKHECSSFRIKAALKAQLFGIRPLKTAVSDSVTRHYNRVFSQALLFCTVLTLHNLLIGLASWQHCFAVHILQRLI